MKMPDDYIAKNRDAWNKRTTQHVGSEFYNMKSFVSGESSLQEIELKLLGNIEGKSILHLQCHFGQDSLSMARMGAAVTGADLSDEAIRKAIEINEQLDLKAKFICCDIYDLPQYLDQTFDIVFTSYGTIGWLPDLSRWAALIERYLKPGGKFIFAEFHPVVWMFDYDFDKVAYNYFKDEPIIEQTTGTYTDRNAPIEYEEVSWNHSLGEVFGSLLEHGMEIIHFEEFDYSPYDVFKHTYEFAPGKFRISHLDNKIPMVYTLVATKKQQP